MTKNNDSILKILHVVSWIIFIGLCVEAGALIFNFVLTLFKPITTQNIYKGLDLSEMYQSNFIHYNAVMSFVIVLALMKAYLFYLVIAIFRTLNIVKPFDVKIAKLIKNISDETFAIAIVSLVAHQYTKKLIQSGYEVNNVERYWSDLATFLMMAAIIYVISKIFEKGIELQNDNDLTI